jgi:phage tail sheath protein FI
MAHGVTVREQPTGVKPPVEISAGLPVYIGTAPINSVDLENVNLPKVAYTLAEAVEQFGALSDDFESWTLHEAIKAHFSAYAVGPIVLINVLDPENAYHVASATGESHQLVDGEVQLQVYGGADEPQLGVLEASVVVTGATLGTDYTLAFDDDGFMVVSIVEGGALAEDDVILVDFDYLDPSGVTADDIIGGYSGGQYTGLEVVEQVYPALRLVPGFILAPMWSSTPEVAARMDAIAGAINGAFRAAALVDLSTDPADIPTYATAGAWKSDNGFDGDNSFPCWPKFKNGDDVYHGSTHLACIANTTDSEVDGIPFRSPSNKSATGTAAVLDDGTEVLLTRPQANSLNDQGIVTFLNGFNGWRLWGNRTGAYPGNTDPKDAFIPIRRMFNWIGNTIILTTDTNVDDPVNRRLIDLVLGTITSFLNGLIAQGALVDGKIEFRADENPSTDLADGTVRWHVTLTPPSPAEEMEFVLEYDPTALEGLFEE